MDSEERFEALEIIVKSRPDGESWFDIIADLISQDCEGTEDIPCTCGLESLGGSSGTLDQCWKYIGIDDDKVTVKVDDLRIVLGHLDLPKAMFPEVKEAVDRLYHELNWWNEWLEEHADESDEEGEEE